MRSHLKPTSIKINMAFCVVLLLFLAMLFILFFRGNVDDGRRRKSNSGYLNRFQVMEKTYKADGFNVVRSIDSLISIGIITRTGPKTRTYVNGQFYEDSVVQEWAIDLPMKDVEYQGHYIDTIFYNPYDSTTLAGLVISKTQGKHDRGKPAYFGNGFVCKKKKGKYDVKIYGQRTSACRSAEESSMALRRIYFSGARSDNENYNLNDIRYFNSKDFWRVQWD